MSYEKRSIKDTLELITTGQMYLPAIQRKYVWSENQIVKLMDSIMRGYPIGTFLFWNISGRAINEKKYSLYEFIREYHERDRYNNPHAPNPITKERIIAVLDGQQRLTSLYLALQGSLAKKIPMKRWNSPDSFPIKELYLNLKYIPASEEDEMAYEFKFLTDRDAAQTTEKKLWYKVKNILQYEELFEINLKVLKPKGWMEDIQIMTNIGKLHDRLTQDKSINYFEVNNTESIDDVLDIFVRVNSGGAVLSKSDLLFSTIVSHWDKARDEMEELLTIQFKKANFIKDNVCICVATPCV